MSLWKDLSDRVDAHPAHESLADAILQAAYLFEKVRIAPEPEDALRLSANHGWSPEVAAEPVDLVAQDSLIASLKRLAATRPDDAEVGAVYWALGKVMDPALREFFVDGLEEHLHRDPGVLFQVLIALDNLGEPVFKRRQSLSFNDVAENRADGEAYLAGLRE